MSIIHFVLQVSQTCFLVILTRWVNTSTPSCTFPKEHRPEQARAQIGVVTSVVTAVVRTVVRTVGSRRVRVVEHPERSRRRQPEKPRPQLIRPYNLSRFSVGNLINICFTTFSFLCQINDLSPAGGGHFAVPRPHPPPVAYREIHDTPRVAPAGSHV